MQAKLQKENFQLTNSAMEDIANIIEKMPIKKGLITRKEYEWLISFKELKPHEQEKVLAYESNILASKSENKAICKTFAKESIKGLPVSKKIIWKIFNDVFYRVQGKAFIQTPETLANIEPIIKYFVKDESFSQCQNLVTSFNGKSLVLSFDKGLLIIGDYGNGKTSILTCLETAFKEIYLQALNENWDNVKDWNDLRFSGAKSHQIVTEFETLENHEARDNFYKKYSSFRFYFDDVKKEKIASNYGKTEIIKEIIEKRYDKKAKLHITCNYKEGYPNDLQEALYEFGDRYGGHIYDRLFEMFNIIEFKGKSFRQ